MKDESIKKFCQETSEWRIRLTSDAEEFVAQYGLAGATTLFVVIPAQKERSERALCKQVRRACIAEIWERLLDEECSVKRESIEALYDAGCIEGVLKDS